MAQCFLLNDKFYLNVVLIYENSTLLKFIKYLLENNSTESILFLALILIGTV